MVFKDLSMWALDVSLIGRHCMVMNLPSNPSIRNQGSCLPSVVDHERRVLNQVKRALTRRNLESMQIQLYLFSAWKI
jgi:hypothetical protein